MNTRRSKGSGPSRRSRELSVAQACEACYNRKIRCDLVVGKSICSNCSMYSIECRARYRKRKRTVTSTSSETELPQPPLEPSSPLASEPPKQASPAQSLSQYSQSEATIAVQPFLGDLRPAAPANDTSPGRSDVQRNRPDAPAEHASGYGEVTNISGDGETVSETTPTGQIHDGRSVYFGAMEGRLVESTKAYPQTSILSPADLAALQHRKAFDLPSRAVKACYIDNFFKYCYPWAPVVEPAWLEGSSSQTPSILLLQAVLMAGSRVTAPSNLAASGEIYERAKALFFSNYEQNPVVKVITCLLLRWWNPTGPDRICMDSSQFWVRTAVGIALEMGLHFEQSVSRHASFRRRLWWTVLAHDSQLSGVHGRPRAIQTEEFHVSPLTRGDFSLATRPRAASAMAFVTISAVFGEIGDCCRRSQMTIKRRTQLINDLYAWVRELPQELRLFHANPAQGLNAYSFEARQLHVIYFSAVLLLCRPLSSTSPISAGSQLAASFVAGIYEEFIIRDEINYLGPGVHKFFLLAAGISLLTTQRQLESRTSSFEDYQIIVAALKKLSERYPSALATLHLLENLEAPQLGNSDISRSMTPMQPEVRVLYREFGPGLCKEWHLAEEHSDAETEGLNDSPGNVANRRPGAESLVRTTSAASALPEPPEVNIPAEQFCDQLDSYTGNSMMDGDAEPFGTFWPLSWPAVPNPTSWILKDTPFTFPDDS